METSLDISLSIKTKILCFFRLVAIGTVVCLSINYSLGNLITWLDPENADFSIPALENVSSGVLFFIVVIVGPLVETLIFQYAIIRIILSFKFKHNEIVAILVSAVAFGLNHFYNTYYVLITFFIGLVFAFYFVQGYRKLRAGFLVVTVIHALQNLATFAEDQFSSNP